MEKEKERGVVNSISKGDVLNSYLSRVSELFYSKASDHESMIEMLTSYHQEEVEFLEMKIKKLECTIVEMTHG
jgi:hypothetical protein